MIDKLRGTLTCPHNKHDSIKVYRNDNQIDKRNARSQPLVRVTLSTGLGILVMFVMTNLGR